jgi:hypothetical protein
MNIELLFSLYLSTSGQQRDYGKHQSASFSVNLMTSDELRIRIEREIAGNWSRTNGHGCDLRQCLMTPVKKTFEDSSDPSCTVVLWLVLEEDPMDCNGYKVVYDEATDEFGLACPFVSGRNGYLGSYGSTFLEAFDAM